jgi:pSer/pThr/pTyr-binding forkhead associated (FHA) protein
VTSVRFSRSSRDDVAGAIELIYRDRVVRVDTSCPRVELGRDRACDLSVEGSSVSRLHAIVEWDHGRVRVEDMSTNGTRIDRVGAAPSLVHHRGIALTGDGILRLGGDVPDEQCALVAYRCLGNSPRRPESH